MLVLLLLILLAFIFFFRVVLTDTRLYPSASRMCVRVIVAVINVLEEILCERAGAQNVFLNDI